MKTQVLPESFLRRIPKEDRQALGKAGRTNDECVAICEKRSEKKLHEEITQYLRMKGIVVGCQRMDKKSNMLVGYPDFVFVVPGPVELGGIKHLAIPVAIEAKVGSNRLTEDQKRVRCRMIANGWNYFVIRKLHELKTVLDTLQEVVK